MYQLSGNSGRILKATNSSKVVVKTFYKSSTHNLSQPRFNLHGTRVRATTLMHSHRLSSTLAHIKVRNGSNFDESFRTRAVISSQLTLKLSCNSCSRLIGL